MTALRKCLANAVSITLCLLLDVSLSKEISSRQVRQVIETTAIAETTIEPNLECYNFEIRMGISFRNYHSCCKTDSTPATVNKPAACSTSFNEKNHVFDCKPQKSTYMKIHKTEYFDCAGCAGQTWAKDKCGSRWFWLGKHGSFNCWAMSDCFKRACQAQEDQLQIGNEVQVDLSFCGDGLCEPIKNETKITCPLDCCAAENPKKCAATNNTCPDICCSEKHCCDLVPSSLGDFGEGFWKWFLIIIAGAILFVNLLCCICCWCIYGNCKNNIKRRKRSRKAKAYAAKTESVQIEYVQPPPSNPRN
ncbi:uncharacterized protein [Antedon mediterranea]|uniref:uncharacterized protein n=1 Tax=Antedon mediterranea TaxID=105859 RepID=UPI003AF88FDE